MTPPIMKQGEDEEGHSDPVVERTVSQNAGVAKIEAIGPAQRSDEDILPPISPIGLCNRVATHTAEEADRDQDQAKMHDHSRGPSRSPPSLKSPTPTSSKKIPIPPVSHPNSPTDVKVDSQTKDESLSTDSQAHPLPHVQCDDPPNSWSDSLYKPLKAHLTLLHPQTPPAIVAFCATRLLSPDTPYGYQGEEWTPLYLERSDEHGMSLEHAELQGGTAGSESRFDAGADEQDSGLGQAQDSSSSPCSPNRTGAAPEKSQRKRHRGVGFDLLTAGVRYDAPKDLRAKHDDQCTRGKEMDQRLEEMYRAARESWEMLEKKAPSTSCRL
ncbi:hypothetical protein IAU59_005336 [Kwoniella sp. CBS 9459]